MLCAKFLLSSVYDTSHIYNVCALAGRMFTMSVSSMQHRIMMSISVKFEENAAYSIMLERANAHHDYH